MTDTAPAAATGLPSASSTFDRRSFLATLAAAGVMTASATVPAPAADHPDAELFALVALYEASDARGADCVHRLDEAFAAYHEPDPPEALFWRKSDFMGVCVDRGRLAQYKVSGEVRFVYDNERVIAGMHESLARWHATRPADRFCNTERDIARMEEIIAAHVGWRRAKAEAETAAGITSLYAESDHERETALNALMRLAALPAVTPQGIAAKARAAAIYWAGDPADMAGRLQRMLSADDPDYENVLGVSLVIDAMKIGGATPTYSDRSAA